MIFIALSSSEAAEPLQLRKREPKTPSDTANTAGVEGFGMRTLLHQLLTNAFAVALLLAALPVAAQGGKGSTRFTVRIDPQAAAVVQAWRAAHGLSTPAAPVLAMTARRSAPAAAFEQHCRDAGGSSVAVPVASSPTLTAGGSVCT
ncbi:MAG TPA: hypothetical protein VFW82_13730 [Dyella sp.]|nr:hypothetical protein [Dyella sp.]